jgi:hypothetical protein
LAQEAICVGVIAGVVRLGRRKCDTLLWSVLLAFLAFAFVTPASATTLTETVGIGFSASGPLFLQPFDHDLGTLTSVDVTINGQISALVLTNPNLVPIPPYGQLVPVPQPFSVALDQIFSGIPNDAFFRFSLQPATFQLNGISSGLGETQQLTSNFFYGFHLDANTDFVGFTGISATGPLINPGLVSGTLAGFTDTFFPLMQEFIETTPSAVYPPAVNSTLLTWSDDGAILLQYNYTPAPTPTPEPSSLLLLGTSLLGLMGAGLYKKRLA